MPGRILHVQLSPEATACLDTGPHRRNRAGRTLRDWLFRSFQASRVDRSSQSSFFGTIIEVDDDVPLLLEALGRVTKRNPDELVEAWALEASEEDGPTVSAPRTAVYVPADVRGKLAELLDLGETLFEETVADARRRLGSYPEGERATRVGADVFRGLRALLSLSPAESEADTGQTG